MGNCCDLFQSTSTASAASSSTALRVCFCQKYKAPSVSLTNQRLCAEGAGAGGTVLCDTPIDQLRAFWEFTIEDMGSNQGHFSIGVMRRANLKPPPNDKQVLLFFLWESYHHTTAPPAATTTIATTTTLTTTTPTTSTTATGTVVTPRDSFLATSWQLLP